MITSPTLLLDEETCLENIRRMKDKADRHGLTLKPHFKTHQSAEIGEWFRAEGVTSITVSSLRMANYFAEQGWKNITIGFPVNIREIEGIDKLASQIEELYLFAYNERSLYQLETKLNHPVGIYIEIDTGANRSGLKIDELPTIRKNKNRIDSAENMWFKGFYSHPGHSYAARSAEEVSEIHADILSQVNRLKKEFPDASVCIGDTPCCSVAHNFDGIDEISPGNFVFYDLMQSQIGSCSIKDLAVCLATPVVAIYPERRELILHGGAVHLSKDNIEWNGKTIFGRPVWLQKNYKWSAPIQGSYLKAVSQEHGVLSCSDELLEQVEIGDLLGILPVHSCLTANLMGNYYILEKNSLIN